MTKFPAKSVFGLETAEPAAARFRDAGSSSPAVVSARLDWWRFGLDLHRYPRRPALQASRPAARGSPPRRPACRAPRRRGRRDPRPAPRPAARGRRAGCGVPWRWPPARRCGRRSDRFAADEAVALHADDEPGHRRRADLLGLGELADGDAPAEDHDRQGRGARRRQPHRPVLPAQAPQQVDGGGMQPLGDAVAAGGGVVLFF